MKKLKKHKLPKKPKKSASLETLKNYLKKCNEIHKMNRKIESDHKTHEKLYNKIKGY